MGIHRKHAKTRFTVFLKLTEDGQGIDQLVMKDRKKEVNTKKNKYERGKKKKRSGNKLLQRYVSLEGKKEKCRSIGEKKKNSTIQHPEGQEGNRKDKPF